jgi:hypothetical protein
MNTIETPYGTATIGDYSCSVEANAYQLHKWANRPGAHWPCSELDSDDVDSVVAGFDTGGLVDLEIFPSEPIDLTGDELSAWTSDVLETAGLPADHPCYLVCVGQFRD